MKVTHHELMGLGVLLGYIGLDKGLCVGFSGMWMQAVFAQEEHIFYERLSFIATYKNNFPALVADINKAKQNKYPNEKNIQLLDILGFFDGIQLYLLSSEHNVYFPESRHVNQTDFQAIFPLVKSILLEENEVEVLLDKDYIFTKTSLTAFLNDLAQQLSQTSLAIPIILGSDNHSVCLKYDRQNSCWHYIDTNDFLRFSNSDAYFRKLNTKSLVDSVFTSFNTTINAFFNTKLLTIHKDAVLKKNMRLLDLNYPIGLEQINSSSSDNVGIFFIACQFGRTELVKELLKPKYKTDINKAYNESATPFFVACKWGDVEIVKELLKPEYKTDIHKAANGGVTPFLVACYYGHLEIIKELLKPEYGTNINKARNEGETPFCFACHRGHTEIVKELLKSNYKTDINKANNKGATPFYAACYQGHIEIISELLKPEYGTDINKANNNGVTPFYIACQKGYLEIIKKLVASTHFKTLDSVGITGHTPLLVACLYSHPQDLYYELLKNNASMTHKNEANQTALDIAFSTGSQSAISVLLSMARIKKYPPLDIMSSQTIEKAKYWAQLNSDFVLNDYLNGKETYTSSVGMIVLIGFIEAIGITTIATAFILFHAATFASAGLLVASIGFTATLCGIGLFATDAHKSRQTGPDFSAGLLS